MTHHFAVTVYYEDTDMGGIVYHANYLKYIERARSAWVAEMGLDQNALSAAGLVFVVRHIESDFLAPARLGDALEVKSRIEASTGVRWILRQEVWRGALRLFSARVTIVAMDRSGHPTRLPAELRRGPDAEGGAQP
ncbi:MAG: tol-pal system-associated acyl-CoA thioesterase [Pseudomonadota bacterium]